MKILNKHSNLTPKPRIETGNGIAKGMYRVFEKKSQDKRNNAGGLEEHTCYFSTPYTCVSTAF